jgi:cell division protein FtsB
MLKAARKEDAQRLFAKMIKVDEAEEEDSLKSPKDAENMVKPKSAKAPVASGAGDKHGEVVKAKVEQADFDEDLDVLISEEATLSDGFKEKAGTIFEAVLTSKLTQEVDRLESEYASNLEDEVKEINDDLVEKVNAYLDYVVENWMKENELAVSNGLRTEIAEEFMTSLQQVFKEHYIEVPEGKVDLVDELNEQVNELEETLNKTTEDNVKLHSEVSDYRKQEIVREQSSGLAETEAEKLASLVEDVEFEDSETFETKVKTIRDSYFKSEVNESVDEVDSLLGEDNADESVVSESMARYTQAINKHIS